MHIPEQRRPLIDIFLERNSKINLSAIRDAEWVYQKHIVDALEIQNVPKNPITPGKNLLDIWTGWWFPLLPLATIYPEVQCRGIDARKKKIMVIEDMINVLWLKNCTALRWRAEEHKQKYDLVTARWVAYADKILQRAVPKTKRQWRILLWKQFTFEENADIRELCHQYNLYPERDHHYTLSWDETKRVIYCLRKQ